MKLSEKWAIAGNRFDFVLTESSVRKDPKTGVDKISTKQSYHPSIEQCFNKVVKSELVGFVDESMTADLAEIKSYLDDLRKQIKEIADATQAAIQTDGQ